MHSFSTYTDAELVDLLQQDRETAFTEIYQRYWKLLYQTASNVLRQQEPSKDAVQEVFVSLWRRRHEVDIVSLKPYLYQALRFQVYKAIRAGKTSRDFFERITLVSREVLLQDPLLYKDLEHLLHSVMQSLPEDQREIFYMSRDLGMTYHQIAAEKRISVKTVEKKMSLTLRLLRMKFGKQPMLFFLI